MVNNIGKTKGTRTDNPTTQGSKNDLLKILLTEYDALRGELVKIFDRELQIFTIIVSALGVIYGIIFSQGVYDLLLFIPILVLPLALKFKYETYGVDKISKYLLEIEKQIKEEIDTKKWMGWQTNWDKLGIKREWTILKYDVSSKWLLFIVIPMGIAILYSLIIINPENFSFITSKIGEDISHFNQKIHSIMVCIYGLFIFFTLIIIIWKNAFIGCIKPILDNSKKERKKKGEEMKEK